MNHRAEISATFFDLKAWGLHRSRKINIAIREVGYDLLGLLLNPNDTGLKFKAMLDVEVLRIIARNEG